MRKRLLTVCGVLAPIVYAATVLLGAALRPGYSHLSQAVSDLIAAGAPNKTLLDPLFAFYNLLTVAFGANLYLRVRADRSNRAIVVGTFGSLALMIEAVLGLSTLLFPEDSGGLGTKMTFTGSMHIVCAGLSSFTSMLAMLLMGFWFRGSASLYRYSLYSFISVAGVFVSGGLAAASIANQSALGGLMERLTIGGFLQWLLVLALIRCPSAATSGEPADLSARAGPQRVSGQSE